MRTLLIGLDGATFTVLAPLVKDGVMPFLGELMARGTRAELISTPNPLTPPAWTSLATGQPPGHHGIFDFIRPDETEAGVFIRLLSSRDVRCETIWSMVSGQGGRVAVLNFPVTYPVRPVSGYVVPGFVPLRHLRRAVYPSALYEQLVRRPSFDARALAMDLDREKQGIQGLPFEQWAEWIRVHIRRERQWFEILRHVMETDPCDLTAIVFDGADKLQHLAWRFVAGDGLPDALTPGEEEVREACLAYFRDLDGYLRHAVALAGPETRVFLASDHGFGPTQDIFYLNVWLHQHGYLHWGEAVALDEGENVLAARMKTQYALLDWSRTAAYALSPSSNGIYIRVARRPGQPGIAPERYEAFRDELVRKLLAFTDPESGERIVTRVMRREDVFAGPAMATAPDLTLVLRDQGFISILNAGQPLRRRSEPKGMHRPEGIFVAAGPGIKSGLVTAPLSITDVAPALLYSLGYHIPGEMQGRLPVEIFDEALLETRPPARGSWTPAPDLPAGLDRAAALTDDEERAVLSRLRELGYLE